MGLHNWLKRLERDAREEMIEIPQPDGTVARFPQTALPEAFMSMYEGRDHPLLAAVRNSSELAWSEGVYSTDPASMLNVVDLSE
jgi:hypothetical protein